MRGISNKLPSAEEDRRSTRSPSPMAKADPGHEDASATTECEWTPGTAGPGICDAPGGVGTRACAIKEPITEVAKQPIGD